jgi:hypothetical protein
MASTIFCCSQIKPYPRRTSTDHDHKFNPFIEAGLTSIEAPTIICSSADDDLKAAALSEERSFAIQLVRQVNYGPLESTRYFTPSPESAASTSVAESRYIELSEEDLIATNFTKVNSYKNFKRHSQPLFRSQPLSAGPAE